MRVTAKGIKLSQPSLSAPGTTLVPCAAKRVVAAAMVHGRLMLPNYRVSFDRRAGMLFYPYPKYWLATSMLHRTPQQLQSGYHLSSATRSDLVAVSLLYNVHPKQTSRGDRSLHGSYVGLKPCSVEIQCIPAYNRYRGEVLLWVGDNTSGARLCQRRLSICKGTYLWELLE